MRFLAALALLGLGAAGCDSSSAPVPLVPDGTPFIVSTLEASPDTLFHVPQVYVATIRDMYTGSPTELYDLFQHPDRLPGPELWHPLLWSQVGFKLRALRMEPTVVTDADVRVTGPLGEPGEQTVAFVSVGRGSYADTGDRLDVRSGARYRLDVTYPDGRAYTSETRVPAPARWTLPDTLVIPTHIDESSTPGAYLAAGWIDLDWTPSPDVGVTVMGVNHRYQFDADIWSLGPGESLPFRSRNDYVRAGAQYVVGTTRHPSFPQPSVGWYSRVERGRNDPEGAYLRLYQLNDDLSRYYSPEDEWTTTATDDPWKIQSWNEGAVVSDRNTAYFPSISNILRVGPGGQALPKAQSDAVGIFGAFSSRYARRMKVSRPTFDPDTLDWTPRPARPSVPARTSPTGPRAPRS